MIYDVQNGYRPFPHSPLFSFADLCSDAAEFSVMQSTGFTDKNGKEIYEGDIVTFIDKNWVVAWHAMQAGFTLSSTGPVVSSTYIASAGVPIRGFTWLDDGKAGYLQIEKRSSPIEVIGSTHENPELLTQ